MDKQKPPHGIPPVGFCLSLDKQKPPGGYRTCATNDRSQLVLSPNQAKPSILLV